MGYQVADGHAAKRQDGGSILAAETGTVPSTLVVLGEMRMPIDYSEYPDNWREIRARILNRAGNRCEGSPRYPACRAENGYPHPVTGNRVVLTIGHLDHDPSNSDPSNLRAWCQRCHLTYDAQLHANHARETRIRKQTAGMEELF